MTVLLFGIAKDIVGCSTLSVPTSDAMEVNIPKTVKELKRSLVESYPGLNKLSSMAIAVNSSYADDGQAIGPDDEIALIPPVSGG